MRLLSIIILDFILFFSAHGQDSKFDIGLEGGPSLATTRGYNISDLDDEDKPLPGFTVGLVTQYHFHKFFSVKTMIGYERKGQVYNLNLSLGFDPIPIIHTKQIYDYVTIPILLSSNVGEKIQFIGEAGAFFGILARRVTKIDDGINPPWSEINTSYFKRFDTGLTIGIGLSVPIKKKFALSFLVRNNIGFFQIDEAEVDWYKLKTFSSNMLLGFSYKLNRKKES